MKITSVGSSSSGNSYIIEANNKIMILDAGLSCIRIISALETLGLAASDVSSILITHEHSDHVQCIKTLAGKCPNAMIYASCGTIANCAKLREIDDDRIVTVEAGGEYMDDEVKIRAYELSHDAAEPVGYSVTASGVKLSVVTDTGTITDDIYNEISDSDMMVLEANHDEHLLMYGGYPYQLKMRIKSDSGHLSNRAAGELLADLLRDRAARAIAKGAERRPLPVMLAHLSFHNNAAFRARASVEEILRDAGFGDSDDYILTIASKDELTVIDNAEY